MNRRDFLIASALVLVSGKTLGDVCVNQYQKGIIHKIYELPKYIYKIDAFANVEGKNEHRHGFGVVVDNHYLTMAHIVNFSKRRVRTPFGIMENEVEVKEEKAKINDSEIERIVFNDREDIAIYKLPKELNVQEFPCKPTSKRKLGDEVFLIGNPYMTGWNIRKGNISDLDQYGDNLPIESFGIDFPGIPGDSGCPVVNSNYELLGLQATRVEYTLGYIKKIEDYLKYIK